MCYTETKLQSNIKDESKAKKKDFFFFWTENFLYIQCYEKMVESYGNMLYKTADNLLDRVLTEDVLQPGGAQLIIEIT